MPDTRSHKMEAIAQHAVEGLLLAAELLDKLSKDEDMPVKFVAVLKTASQMLAIGAAEDCLQAMELSGLFDEEAAA